MSDRFFINMPIPADKYEAVCAVLAGVSTIAVAGAIASQGNAPGGAAASQDTGNSSAGAPTPTLENQDQAGTGATATTDASPSDVAIDPNDIDAHGHPWNPDLHAGTKGKTKDGLWRMKVGVSRPEPLPGFPKEGAAAGDTGTSSETATPSATLPAVTEPASAPTPTAVEDEDEFAAFRAAAEASNAADATAAASVPARQYSDADLGALCNQAAVKLGDPAPIKAIIASYTPAGEVAHSRNIPADKRAEFVKAVEDKAGIQFAG